MQMFRCYRKSSTGNTPKAKTFNRMFPVHFRYQRGCKVFWVIAISLIIFHSPVVTASFRYLCARMSKKTWRFTWILWSNMGSYIQLKHENCLEDLKASETMSTVISSGKASSLSVSDVLKQFHTDPVRGLSYDEVERRRKFHGLNEFDVVEDVPLWRKYIEQVQLGVLFT